MSEILKPCPFCGGKAIVDSEPVPLYLRTKQDPDGEYAPVAWWCVCEKCGAEVPAGSAFCASCGAKIESAVSQPSQQTANICSNCGAVLAEGAQFCVSCGHKVGE